MKTSLFALVLLMTSASGAQVKKDAHLKLAQAHAKINTKTHTKARVSAAAKLRAALNAK